jgi:hypothetical protein
MLGAIIFAKFEMSSITKLCSSSKNSGYAVCFKALGFPTIWDIKLMPALSPSKTLSGLSRHRTDMCDCHTTEDIYTTQTLMLRATMSPDWICSQNEVTNEWL